MTVKKRLLLVEDDRRLGDLIAIPESRKAVAGEYEIVSPDSTPNPEEIRLKEEEKALLLFMDLPLARE